MTISYTNKVYGFINLMSPSARSATYTYDDKPQPRRCGHVKLERHNLFKCQVATTTRRVVNDEARLTEFTWLAAEAQRFTA
jgi:hypothetical protein